MTTWLNQLEGTALALEARLVHRTARYLVQGNDNWQAAQRDPRPVILAAWHGMTMMLAGYFLQQYDMSRLVLMMPDDWRGDALNVFAQKLGGKPFPMNLKGDETLAAARTFARLVRMVKQGHDCYITPDGPDGPAYVIKPGVAYLAQKSKALLLPIGAYTRGGYRLPRWDTYVVPYPFARISLVIGAPQDVPADAPYETITQPLTDALHRVTAAARANYYEARKT
ncbi:MAG: hypothetical protein KC418_11210 [Anaerolineales bacterium]|nr:hypothetical protein [Anaerolineales bacterium]MCB8951467.1 hypothetical protein [Ardenticatenales bacterium]